MGEKVLGFQPIGLLFSGGCLNKDINRVTFRQEVSALYMSIRTLCEYPYDRNILFGGVPWLSLAQFFHV